ncbi:MAG: hypothetical protein IM594_11425 [Cytophagales bacterium]|jgi:hypothetical protein|nr:hypothetical protein [Cytophagales bacterium]MCA6406211.1 hypothetical protein [Cytophagales bacterium]MCA6413523.1 hypothetical protein [Cytophagales bacterium]MCA6420388.1 hypothetical protein [Cytophagales bacterium]MCA6427034.1 hypothetical protein [Cytophagales bacterium]
MATTSVFEFFEVIASELASEPSRVITSTDLAVKGEMPSLLEDIKAEMRKTNTDDAINDAVELLKQHFEDRSSDLPFDYDPTTGRFTATDPDYLEFVNKMVSIRSVGNRSRDFECSVAERLGLKTTGAIHRVGWPRDVKKLKNDFIKHLKTLGFSKDVIYGREKDGGLDILWLPPIGSIPHRPIMSVQCKNGEFDLSQAHVSIGTGSGTLAEHIGLQGGVHVPCVIFNDFVYPDILPKKRMNFVPLGLSDLARLRPTPNPVVLI